MTDMVWREMVVERLVKRDSILILVVCQIWRHFAVTNKAWLGMILKMFGTQDLMIGLVVV